MTMEMGTEMRKKMIDEMKRKSEEVASRDIGEHLSHECDQKET